MTQLSLNLSPRRAPPRELPVIERLHAVIRRQGIDPEWRGKPYHKGPILLTPCLDAGERHRTIPRDENTGLPAQGLYESLCSRYLCGFHIVQVSGYSEHEYQLRSL